MAEKVHNKPKLISGENQNIKTIVISSDISVITKLVSNHTNTEIHRVYK